MPFAQWSRCSQERRVAWSAKTPKQRRCLAEIDLDDMLHAAREHDLALEIDSNHSRSTSIALARPLTHPKLLHLPYSYVFFYYGFKRKSSTLTSVLTNATKRRLRHIA
jgi:hypothetical protein